MTDHEKDLIEKARHWGQADILSAPLITEAMIKNLVLALRDAEKALTPTDDEREALLTEADALVASGAETLPGLEARPSNLDDEFRQGAARVIAQVRDTFVADRDKLMCVVNAGGNLVEMRAAVDAAWLLKEIISGLELAIDRALQNGPEEVGR